jgi:hypothetical protein
MSYKSKCEYNAYETGRQRFFDRATKESTRWDFPVEFYDDFIGADVVIPATGSVESGCKWSKKITGSAPPTVAKTGDGVNGLVACSLTSGSEAQEAALQMNDELMFSIAQGCVYECRLTISTAPTLNGVISWGLHGAYAAGGSNFRAGFEVTAASLIPTCEVDDNVTDTSAASAVTLVVGTYNIFRIDATTQTDIKFFIDDVPVAGSTTFASAASAANSKMQPHCGCYKASGAGLGVVTIDYVKVWQERS